MRIKNINGSSTGSYKCKCGSWMKHWLRFSGQAQAQACAVIGCYNRPIDGVHVQKHAGEDKSWYIVPLCREHYLSHDSLVIGDAVDLVPADTSITCG